MRMRECNGARRRQHIINAAKSAQFHMSRAESNYCRVDSSAFAISREQSWAVAPASSALLNRPRGQMVEKLRLRKV